MENKQWQVRFSNPKTIAPPNGYSHVVEVTGSHRTIFISGQVGLTEKAKLQAEPPILLPRRSRPSRTLAMHWRLVVPDSGTW